MSPEAHHYSYDINALARDHYVWVERMGWHNKSVLQALALILSEVGEAVNECRGEFPTAAFGSELTDIVLRTADLAQWQGVDLARTIETLGPEAVLPPGETVLASLARIGLSIASAVPQKTVLGSPCPLFSQALATTVYQVDQLAAMQGLDLAQEIASKRAINAQNGTRGRRI